MTMSPARRVKGRFIIVHSESGDAFPSSVRGGWGRRPGPSNTPSLPDAAREGVGR